MADGLGEGDFLAPADVQGPGFAAHRTEAAASGAGLLFAQGAGLLLQEGGEGPLGQAAGGFQGELFQGGQIDVQPWALVAEGAAGDDFAPAGSQFTNFTEVFGGEFSARHDLPALDLRKRRRRVALPFLFPSFYHGKAGSGLSDPSSGSPTLSSRRGVLHNNRIGRPARAGPRLRGKEFPRCSTET